MSAVGEVLHNRYEIIAEIGKGGMSTVYMAKDKNLGSYWAVKQVKNDNQVKTKAFKEEVELLASLSYPDIPRIVDRIEVNKNYFVIMDLVNGIPLDKKIAVEGPQQEKEIIEWAKMLCDILLYLHTVRRNPIVYCDIKPSNIMLTTSGRIKLIDFGIAKECVHEVKQTGTAVGSKGYAAPEQYSGASNILDERTDIYSLGATIYTLATGITPNVPPNEIRPIRQIYPSLSEGLEHIVCKCMKTEPADRYQTCDELHKDLDNIEKLNSRYRKKMQKRLLKFCISSVLTLLCLGVVFIGYTGMRQDNENKFQLIYGEAESLENHGDHIEASNKYCEAIECKPNSIEIYQKLYNLLLPKSGDENYIQKTKTAIDTLRKYIDNPRYPIYHNYELMYQMIKQCINVNDSAYASIALNYISIIKDSSDYKNGLLNTEEFDSLEIIALNSASSINTQNFTKLNNALLKLEKNIDKRDMTADSKLNDYYIILIVYNTYPSNLLNSYTRTIEIGEKAKKIIDSNAQSESLTFNNIIPMYELVASSMYSCGTAAADPVQKRNMLKSSIKWFGYLNDLNDDLSEALILKCGNAHKEIFESYMTVKGQYEIAADAYKNLESAIESYTNILKIDSSNFLAAVNLTQAYLDMELVKPANSRSFTFVKSAYAKVLEIKSNNKNLTNISLSQFSSLKSQMENAGLEV